MTALYIRLAAVGIRKNGRAYIPYILTSAVMVSVMYIVTFLSSNPLLEGMPGGRTMKIVLSVGIAVMAVFSAIFLFYTNSFLIKRRKKEFGLYNILGLKKSQIARVLVWETLLVYALSVIGGLGLGILFSKLAEHLAMKMLRGKINYTFTVDIAALIITLIVFAAIFFVILMNSLRQLFFSRPIELLRSGSTGEKPPRTNVPFAVMGLILLGCAYYMAVTIENPGFAIPAFMLAVIMVILATYLLFIAGSVVLCAVLRKNKHYYYKTAHFVSVSQMAYRMRKNGAGLASICILATMVLVTVSSTATLYFGVQSYVNREHSTDIEVSIGFEMLETVDLVEETIIEVCDEHAVTPRNFFEEYSLEFSGDAIGNVLGIDSNMTYIRSEIFAADVFPEEPVKALELEDWEIAYYEPFSNFMEGRESIKLNENLEFSLQRIDKRLRITDSYVRYQNSAGIPDPVIIMFVNNRETLYEIWQKYERPWGLYMRCGFDADEGMSAEDIYKLEDKLHTELILLKKSMAEQSFFVYTDTKTDAMGNTYGVYGGLFFLGLLLGGVFLLAAVLIMYYKQITEGFEDAARFEILHKVGMSRREIKSTINSQVLTVFFLPLVAAGLHMTFAFPIIARLLTLFGMTSTGLFALVTLGSYLIFSAVYIIVYKMTSGSYSRIVNK